ncbi:CvpA family protein [Sphingobacterium pedocola]|nr:CvpA family protein [Sphingobacterium pedocola]
MIDIILLLIVLTSIWNGVARGFFAGMTGLVSWLGSLLITFAVYRHVALFLEANLTLGIWTMPLSFLLTLLIVGSILSLFAAKALNAIPLKIQEHRLNNIFGVVPGVVTGLLYAAILSTLLLLLPFSEALTRHTRESKIAERLTNGLTWIERPFAPALEAVNRSINKMTIEPGSSESISLPFVVEAPKPRPDLERQMLGLVNEERAKAKLPALTLDEELTSVARQHSEDMFVRSYFSHISPEGNTPFDRIRAANIRFLTAGENLALAQTLPLAHDGLMNSPGHRANILRKTFRRVGIGILDGGKYGLMVTQKFRN